MQLDMQEPIKVSDHPAKFGGHRYSGGGNIMFLVCHVLLTYLRHQQLLDYSHLIKILLAKCGGHKSYRNGDINSYMDILEKAEFSASIRHIARFLKSGIPIYNSEVPDMAGIKTRRRRRTQAIAERFAFYANAKIHSTTF